MVDWCRSYYRQISSVLCSKGSYMSSWQSHLNICKVSFPCWPKLVSVCFFSCKHASINIKSRAGIPLRQWGLWQRHVEFHHFCRIPFCSLVKISCVHGHSHIRHVFIQSLTFYVGEHIGVTPNICMFTTWQLDFL